jgi:hypothetical protein
MQPNQSRPELLPFAPADRVRVNALCAVLPWHGRTGTVLDLPATVWRGHAMRLVRVLLDDGQVVTFLPDSLEMDV